MNKHFGYAEGSEENKSDTGRGAPIMVGGGGHLSEELMLELRAEE